jgi:hypothetical protein
MRILPKNRRPIIAILLVILGLGTVEIADGDVDSMPVLGAILRAVTENSTSQDTPEEDLDTRRR